MEKVFSEFYLADFQYIYVIREKKQIKRTPRESKMTLKGLKMYYSAIAVSDHFHAFYFPVMLHIRETCFIIYPSSHDITL